MKPPIYRCGNGDKGGSDDKKITVGASPAPHAEILEKAKPFLLGVV
jgi:D-methionine transport system substrate-binding protein